MKPIYALMEAVLAQRAAKYGYTRCNPDLLTVTIPDHIVKEATYPGDDATPYLFYHTRVAEKVTRGVIVDGDLLYCSKSVMRVDLKLVPGLCALVPYPLEEVKDWLKFQNIRLPKYGRPAKLTNDERFYFKMKFHGREIR